jgi:hypothetical protein
MSSGSVRDQGRLSGAIVRRREARDYRSCLRCERRGKDRARQQLRSGDARMQPEQEVQRRTRRPRWHCHETHDNHRRCQLNRSFPEHGRRRREWVRGLGRTVHGAPIGVDEPGRDKRLLDEGPDGGLFDVLQHADPGACEQQTSWTKGVTGPCCCNPCTIPPRQRLLWQGSPESGDPSVAARSEADEGRVLDLFGLRLSCWR